MGNLLQWRCSTFSRVVYQVSISCMINLGKGFHSERWDERVKPFLIVHWRDKSSAPYGRPLWLGRFMNWDFMKCNHYTWVRVWLWSPTKPNVHRILHIFLSEDAVQGGVLTFIPGWSSNCTSNTFTYTFWCTLGNIWMVSSWGVYPIFAKI